MSVLQVSCYSDFPTILAIACTIAFSLESLLRMLRTSAPPSQKIRGFLDISEVCLRMPYRRGSGYASQNRIPEQEGRPVTPDFALDDEGESFGIFGRDAKIRQIIEIINTAAPSDASVLIEGESGTGKELIATAFHFESQRAAGPFIRINCAAIPHELIESELFGYKKGAFTGADRDKRGLIEAANN